MKFFNISSAAEKKQNAVYAPATRKYFFSYGK